MWIGKFSCSLFIDVACQVATIKDNKNMWMISALLLWTAITYFRKYPIGNYIKYINNIINESSYNK